MPEGPLAPVCVVHAAGPTKADPDRIFMCKEGDECIVNVQGKNMKFLSMGFSRLAALDTCGVSAGRSGATHAAGHPFHD